MKTNITIAATMTTMPTANSSCKYSLTTFFMAQKSYVLSTPCILTTGENRFLTHDFKKIGYFAEKSAKRVGERL